MSDYGAIVSQKGYDAKTCADRFLVYSSAFQTLKVFGVYSVSAVVPSDTTSVTITHNLGYYSPFFVIYNGSSIIGTTNSYFMSDSVGDDLRINNYLNSLTLTIPSWFDNYDTGATVYFTIYIFIDDFSTVLGQNINTGTTIGSLSSDYGIRISKAGYDVKTCADIDCVLSSSFFNQIIHSKGIATGNIAHTLGYVPSQLVYAFDTDHIYYSKTQIDSTTLYSNSGDYYIIFKNKII